MNLSTLFRSVLLRLSSGCLICLRQGLNDSPTCLPEQTGFLTFRKTNNRRRMGREIAEQSELYWIGILKNFVSHKEKKFRTSKRSLDVIPGRSREKKPERILISTVDRTEFFYLSGRASVHLQSSSLSSGPRPGVVRTEREKWERPEENNLCFVPCSHKKLFYWDPFPLHINILNQAKLFTRKMKTKDSFTRQKTRFRGFLGNSPKQLKLSFG